MSPKSLFFNCAALTLAFASIVSAQESALDRFNKVHAQWKELDAKIDKTIDEFRTANDDRKAELRKVYEQQSNEAKELRPQLRSAGVAAYKESPNEPNVTSVLVGLLSANVFSDHYTQAKEISDLLTKHDCQDESFVDRAGVVAYATHDFEQAEKRFLQAKKAGNLSRQSEFYLERIKQTKEHWAREQQLREKEKQVDDLPRVKLETSKGVIVLELFENEAPQSVGNFVSLVESGFYDKLTFHRVLPGFMAQGGCPDGSGSGGPGYKVYCECEQENARAHFAGTLSMAHAGKNTGGSQFFLTFRPTPHLDGKHTAFGRVVKGMEVLAKLQRIDPNRNTSATPDRIEKATVLRKRDHEYKPTKVE